MTDKKFSEIHESTYLKYSANPKQDNYKDIQMQTCNIQTIKTKEKEKILTATNKAKQNKNKKYTQEGCDKKIKADFSFETMKAKALDDIFKVLKGKIL